MPFNFEAFLRKHICFEDMDTFLLIGVTEDGKIELTDYQSTYGSIVANTLEETFIEYGKRHRVE